MLLAALLFVTVLDPRGAAIPGATVTLTLPSGKQLQSAAGPDGAASFDDLPPGRHPLRIAHPGFAPWSAAASPGDRIDARLSLAAQHTAVDAKVPSAPRRFWRWLTSCTR